MKGIVFEQNNQSKESQINQRKPKRADFIAKYRKKSTNQLQVFSKHKRDQPLVAKYKIKGFTL